MAAKELALCHQFNTRQEGFAEAEQLTSAVQAQHVICNYCYVCLGSKVRLEVGSMTS